MRWQGLDSMPRVLKLKLQVPTPPRLVFTRSNFYSQHDNGRVRSRLQRFLLALTHLPPLHRWLIKSSGGKGKPFSIGNAVTKVRMRFISHHHVCALS